MLLFKIKKLYQWILLPFSRSANNLMKKSLKLIEPVYLFLIKITNPWAENLSKKIIKSIERGKNR